MGSYDELKQIRAELRKALKQSGVNAKVVGGSGTALFWTDIDYNRKKKESWSDKELRIMQQDFGINIGHPRNSATMQFGELKTKLGSYKYKKFKQNPNYQKFRQEFISVADAQADSGTCCGGAGTIVEKDNYAIDFINQRGISDTRNIVAERILQKRAEALGLRLKHESGWMD